MRGRGRGSARSHWKKAFCSCPLPLAHSDCWEVHIIQSEMSQHGTVTHTQYKKTPAGRITDTGPSPHGWTIRFIQVIQLEVIYSISLSYKSKQKRQMRNLCVKPSTRSGILYITVQIAPIRQRCLRGQGRVLSENITIPRKPTRREKKTAWGGRREGESTKYEQKTGYDYPAMHTTVSHLWLV